MDNKEKRATSKEQFDQLVEESLREMRSISGEDLMNRVLAFDLRMREIIDIQRMPPVLIIGALMNQVNRLSSGRESVAIKHALERYDEHIVANFVTKKEFNILLKMVGDIMEKLEEKPFKPKIE